MAGDGSSLCGAARGRRENSPRARSLDPLAGPAEIASATGAMDGAGNPRRGNRGIHTNWNFGALARYAHTARSPAAILRWLKRDGAPGYFCDGRFLAAGFSSVLASL